jgi:hypothetical protein
MLAAGGLLALRPRWPFWQARLEGMQRTSHVESMLARPITLTFPDGVTLMDFFREIQRKTTSTDLGKGIPINVDPLGLSEVGLTLTSKIQVDVRDQPLGDSLKAVLGSNGLEFQVKDGRLVITSISAASVRQTSR